MKIYFLKYSRRRSIKLFAGIISALFFWGSVNNLYASAENKSDVKSGSELKKANIKLEAIEIASGKKLKAIVTNEDGKPVAAVELHFYVKRNFGLLPIEASVSTTDETGSIMVDFPADLPGDSLGNVFIIAKIEDSEQYENAEAHKIMHWGIPVVINRASQQRALWAGRSNAPVLLIIIVNILLISVWGVIIYICTQLYKVNKIGRSEKEYANGKKKINRKVPQPNGTFHSNKPPTFNQTKL